MSDMEKLLNTPLDDVPKLTPVEAKEWRVTCISADVQEKNGRQFAIMRFAVDGQLYCPPISYFAPTFSINLDESDEKNMQFAASAQQKLKALRSALGLSTTVTLGDFTSNLATYMEESVGCSGWALLAVKDNEEYGPQNVIKRWVKKG